MYTSVARLALTHIEYDLDDLHGKVGLFGGFYSAVGKALRGVLLFVAVVLVPAVMVVSLFMLQ